VTGVTLDNGEVLKAETVVSNSDCVRTCEELLPKKVADKFMSKRKFEAACSGVVLYLGLRKSTTISCITTLSSAAIRMLSSVRSTTRANRRPIRPATFVLRRCPATRWLREMARLLYVLVHTPYLRNHHDWNKMLPAYRNVIINKLKTTAGMEDIEDRIEVEHYADTGRHSSPLSRAERRDLRTSQSWPIHGGFQASQSRF
jgi:diapolycopene oxygenase